MRDDAMFWHADADTCIQQAIQAYIDEGRQAATIRHYYYKLLSAGVLRHLPQYENTKLRAYAWVSKLLSDARDEGLFPFEAVVDNGRRSSTYSSYDNMDWYAYIEATSGYKLDPWRGQAGRVEIIVEKDGLVDMVSSYVSDWRIPVRALDGFNSTTRSKEAANRYGSGKQYTLLCCGDFDPSGLLIPAKLKEKLNQYGSYPDIRRIVLTHTDTKSLPTYAAIAVEKDNPHAKACQWFSRYGDNQHGYEIEALTPTQLRQKIQAAIAPYINRNAFLAAIELEKAVRKQVSASLRRALKGYARQCYREVVPESSLDLQEQLRYFLELEDYDTFLRTGKITQTRYWLPSERTPITVSRLAGAAGLSYYCQKNSKKTFSRWADNPMVKRQAKQHKLCYLPRLPPLQLHAEPVRDLIPLCLGNVLIACDLESLLEIVIDRRVRFAGRIVQLLDERLKLTLVRRRQCFWPQALQNLRDKVSHRLKPFKPGFDTTAPGLDITAPF